MINSIFRHVFYCLAGVVLFSQAIYAEGTLSTPTSVPAPAATSQSAPAAPAYIGAKPSAVVATASSSTAKPVPVGRVIWVKGSFKAIIANKQERVLQKSAIIYVGDTLITDGKSQAQIAFTDNTLMTFRQGTTFFIAQYEYHKQKRKGSAGKYVMQLIEGGFRTITGLIAKANPSDYQVNTPVATIGVRGTDYGTYTSKGKLQMAYYAGEPFVQNSKGIVTLGPGNPYASVEVNTAPIVVQQMPPVFKEKLNVVPAKVEPFKASEMPMAGPASVTNKAVTEPAAKTEPSETKPVVTEEPASTEPAVTEEPASTEPAVTEEPASTEPAATEEPASTEPAATDGPASTEPASTGETTSSETGGTPPGSGSDTAGGGTTTGGETTGSTSTDATTSGTNTQSSATTVEGGTAPGGSDTGNIGKTNSFCISK